MKKILVAAGVMLAASATPASAHRLDEYLQATTVLLTRDHLRLDIRRAPGMAIAKSVLDSIDTNRGGLVGDDEQRAYGFAGAQRFVAHARQIARIASPVVVAFRVRR